MEVYEFSLAIPLPRPFADKWRAMEKCEGLAKAIIETMARAQFAGVELQHGMKIQRGEYGKRKPKIVPPEPVDTAPMPFCRVIHADDPSLTMTEALEIAGARL